MGRNLTIAKIGELYKYNQRFEKVEVWDNIPEMF
jgi:hypothetical protein